MMIENELLNYFQQSIQLIKSFNSIPVDTMCHHIVKVIWGNKSVIIQISLGKHQLKFFFSHVFSQIFSYSFQFLNRYFSLYKQQYYCFINIKRSENFINFSSTIFFANFRSSQSQKLLEVNSSRLIFIKFSKDLIYEFILPSEAQFNKCFFQLGWIYGSRTIFIKNIKRLFNLNDFFTRNCESHIFINWKLMFYYFLLWLLFHFQLSIQLFVIKIQIISGRLTNIIIIRLSKSIYSCEIVNYYFL